MQKPKNVTNGFRLNREVASRRCIFGVHIFLDMTQISIKGTQFPFWTSLSLEVWTHEMMSSTGFYIYIFSRFLLSLSESVIEVDQ